MAIRRHTHLKRHLRVLRLAEHGEFAEDRLEVGNERRFVRGHVLDDGDDDGVLLVDVLVREDHARALCGVLYALPHCAHRLVVLILLEVTLRRQV